eukprot:TRINITY_DN18512_c0_g1_i1.p1 TRINITY_DN18512_c0_g1~~TRINITY_DN18512_c0_g1_i1.p1  ORF type:complete len:204 (-),score=79.26 TRINITY_DN18512_c0_g1_i1:492-1064(-)
MAAAQVAPPCKWAERTDRVFFTVEVPDLKKCDVKLEPSGHVSFEAGKYKLDFDLVKEIDVEKSKWGITARGVGFDLHKKDAGYWNRFVKAGKPTWLSVDWLRWKDEDDEDDGEENLGDLGQLGAGSGAGGFDMDAGEEDEEDMGEEEGDEAMDAPADKPEADAKKPEEEEKEKSAAPAPADAAKTEVKNQ